MGNGLRAQARRVLHQQVAPAYHEASGTQRQRLLEDFVSATGYARKHAQWLLSHAEEVLAPPPVLRRRYGPEVEEALVLAWNTLNRICTKRLLPFLPDLLERLEEQGHLQLSQQHRSQLLSMSAATADRLLQAHRYTPPRGISTTKAGPLLKEQIPIRTYAQWDEAKPGFLEVDLVTHCGGRLQGGCLYTVTLTDVATGWTECLPLLNRGREAVLAALQRARARFPFPILGLDTDNGGEFINEEVAAYCVREQITFTRGRPYEKRDQCFVEQKNGVVVRQVVGHGRLVGEHAYRQLDELYRALHWYVNCFQPSMKLVSKQIEGRTIHRIYDSAKTPLQRVVLSEVLSLSQQQELRTIGKAFDPLRLFQQVEQLQQAIFRCEAGRSSAGQSMPTPKLLPFDLAGCAAELVLPQAGAADALPQQEQEHGSVLNWRRTSNDPFSGHWELILSWVQANPTRSSGDILRELQSLSPGRYEGSHLRTLQRGMRKIRAYLLQTQQEASSPERRGEQRLFPSELLPAQRGLERLDPPFFPEGEQTHAPGNTHPRPSDREPATEEPSFHPDRPTRGPVCPGRPSSKREGGQVVRRSSAASSGTAASGHQPETRQHLTIARAVQQYLQAHRSVGHRPKTLEWHRTALGHFQAYVQTEGHLLLVQQISEATIGGWLASLAQTPTARGTRRSASTIETYARSVRAFCQWLVERGTISRSPLSEHTFPRAGVPLPAVISAATFEQLMRAGFSQQAAGAGAKRQAARDQALLWVLFETGITLSEVCALRVADLDQHTGLLWVRGTGGKDRQIPLGPICLSHLRRYLKQRDAMSRSGLASRVAGGEPLFSTAGKQPLSKNGVSMVVVRFRTRAGLSDIAFSPQVLRHSFALRYLQAGGSPQGLQALMGYEGMAPVRQYLRWYDQLLHEQRRQESQEEVMGR